MRAEREFAVMGTGARVVTHGPGAEADVVYAADRLAELERRWSRFRPDSEIGRINSAQGEPVTVSVDTVLLLRRAIEAWWRTGGAFDPTVGAAMTAHGYDRDFAAVGGGLQDPRPSGAAPGCSGIEIDPDSGRVRVPAGVRLDAGGLGKGLAADIVAAEVLDRGSTGVLVDVGGDLRMAGQSPEDGWIVAVEDPRRPGSEWFRMSLAGGAVATSSTLRRRWREGDVSCHHVMDPRTGRPARGSTVAVTVVADAGWWSEVAATSLLLAEEPGRSPLAGSVEFVALRADGGRRSSPGMTAVMAA